MKPFCRTRCNECEYERVREQVIAGSEQVAFTVAIYFLMGLVEFFLPQRTATDATGSEADDSISPSGRLYCCTKLTLPSAVAFHKRQGTAA